MCDPVTLAIGVAALGGGTAIQSHVADERSDRARDAANEQWALEQGRQQRYDRERQALAGEIFQETAGRENLEQAMADAEARRMEQYRAADALPSDAEQGYVSPAAGADNTRNVQARMDANRTENTAELDSRYQALARLRGLGDALQQFTLFRQPRAAMIDANSGFARESAGIAPAEARYAAQEAADWGHGLDFVGNLATGIGGGMIGAGAMGMAPGAIFGGGEAAAGAVAGEVASSGAASAFTPYVVGATTNLVAPTGRRTNLYGGPAAAY